MNAQDDEPLHSRPVPVFCKTDAASEVSNNTAVICPQPETRGSQSQKPIIDPEPPLDGSSCVCSMQSRAATQEDKLKAVTDFLGATGTSEVDTMEGRQAFVPADISSFYQMTIPTIPQSKEQEILPKNLTRDTGTSDSTEVEVYRPPSNPEVKRQKAHGLLKGESSPQLDLRGILSDSASASTKTDLRGTSQISRCVSDRCVYKTLPNEERSLCGKHPHSNDSLQRPYPRLSLPRRTLKSKSSADICRKAISMNLDSELKTKSAHYSVQLVQDKAQENELDQREDNLSGFARKDIACQPLSEVTKSALSLIWDIEDDNKMNRESYSNTVRAQNVSGDVMISEDPESHRSNGSSSLGELIAAATPTNALQERNNAPSEAETQHNLRFHDISIPLIQLQENRGSFITHPDEHSEADTASRKFVKQNVTNSKSTSGMCLVKEGHAGNLSYDLAITTKSWVVTGVAPHSQAECNKESPAGSSAHVETQELSPQPKISFSWPSCSLQSECPQSKTCDERYKKYNGNAFDVLNLQWESASSEMQQDNAVVSRRKVFSLPDRALLENGHIVQSNEEGSQLRTRWSCPPCLDNIAARYVNHRDFHGANDGFSSLRCCAKKDCRYRANEQLFDAGSFLNSDASSCPSALTGSFASELSRKSDRMDCERKFDMATLDCSVAGIQQSASGGVCGKSSPLKLLGIQDRHDTKVYGMDVIAETEIEQNAQNERWHPRLNEDRRKSDTPTNVSKGPMIQLSAEETFSRLDQQGNAAPSVPAGDKPGECVKLIGTASPLLPRESVAYANKRYSGSRLAEIVNQFATNVTINDVSKIPRQACVYSNMNYCLQCTDLSSYVPEGGLSLRETLARLTKIVCSPCRAGERKENSLKICTKENKTS